MLRRVKLNFKPLSLRQTAKKLGIPRGRAQRILALIGIHAENQFTKRTPSRKRASSKKSVGKTVASAS